METRLPSEPGTISVSELRELLIDLKDNQEGILIRINQFGKGWNPHFMSVVMVTKRGVIFNDETINEFVNVSDIALVKEFELNNPISTKKQAFKFEMNQPIRISGV